MLSFVSARVMWPATARHVELLTVLVKRTGHKEFGTLVRTLVADCVARCGWCVLRYRPCFLLLGAVHQ
jgi:hypothetical protein